VAAEGDIDAWLVAGDGGEQLELGIAEGANAAPPARLVCYEFTDRGRERSNVH
jgi:hypothetical protein